MYSAKDFINSIGFYNREIKNAIAAHAKNKGKTVEQVQKSMIRSVRTQNQVEAILIDIATAQADAWNKK